MTSETPDIDCAEFMRRLWDYLDEELTEESVAEVRRHLERCPECVPHHDFARRFLQALAASRDAGVKAPDALRARVTTSLREAGFLLLSPGPPGCPARRDRSRSRTARAHPRMSPGRSGVGVDIGVGGI